MSDAQVERLFQALTFLDTHGSGIKARRALTNSAASRNVDSESDPRKQQVAMELAGLGVDVTTIRDPSYPPQLAATSKAPAMLFTRGNRDLLTTASVGMCGSRNASERGIEAARSCGEEVAKRGLAVVSGYARGVDTETHLGALRTGGATVIVLAEGITRFRQKRVFAETGLPNERTVIVSQFPPTQAWTAGGAMTRNAVIAGLSRALVVIEAGEKGGTLNAGMTALKMGRPVLALQFDGGRLTPPGNQLLFEQGARPIANRRELIAELERIDPPEQASTQLRFPT